MTTFTDPVDALKDADFEAGTRGQIVYLLDNGDGRIKVATFFTQRDVILEIVHPSPYVES